jgi:hypothetical protein
MNQLKWKVLTRLWSLGGKFKLFPPWESLLSDIPAGGTGMSLIFFYSVVFPGAIDTGRGFLAKVCLH